MQSHPVWVRGLKQENSIKESRITLVAPCMGAWIETNEFRTTAVDSGVAPCMGAWIETQMINANIRKAVSHPVWVRGLKQFFQCSCFATGCRTLYGCVD